MEGQSRAAAAAAAVAAVVARAFLTATAVAAQFHVLQWDMGGYQLCPHFTAHCPLQSVHAGVLALPM